MNGVVDDGGGRCEKAGCASTGESGGAKVENEW
jgi:hypothetical protein